MVERTAEVDGREMGTGFNGSMSGKAGGCHQSATIVPLAMTEM